MMNLIGNVFLLDRSDFILLGAAGLLRMPMFINRIQVGTKAVTSGKQSVVVGIIFIHPQWWSKLLVTLTVLLTSP